MSRLRLNAELSAGLLIVLAFALVALAAPLLAPPQSKTPYLMPSDGYSAVPQPPSAKHPLGTLTGQYDVYYGLVWGARVAFRIGLLVTLGRALIGVLLGLFSGALGGWVDGLLMRLTDAFLSFPIMAAVLVMLAFFTDPLWLQMKVVGNNTIPLALVFFGWMNYARLIRGNVLAERGKEYVQAGIAVGAGRARLIFRHILPNATQGLLVLAAADIGAMVALAAVFNYLGLSGRQPLADWGQMLNLSRDWVIGSGDNAFAHWHTYLPPSLAVVLFSIGWNLIGDGLRDLLDPRTR
jgi:peptide/nickel transport system permease protein